MTDLRKIFVSVSSDKCEAFKAKYVSPAEGSTRNDEYDSKICFLEDTQEIFTKGKLFGLNNSGDVTALSTMIGTLPKRPAVGTEGEAGYEAERDYSSVVEYIQEMATGSATISTKLSSDITVAGGPLADDIDGVTWPWGTKDGNKYIPAGTTFEEIFTKLFLAVKNGTVTLGSITWNPSLSQPVATISKEGEQEVGEYATVTFSTTSTVSSNTRSVKITSTQGYFKNNSAWASGTCTISKDGSTTGNVAISASTWNGTTVATGSQVTIVEGENKLSVTQGGITASVDALDSDVVYASTNTKSKLTDVKVTVSDTKPADKSLTKTKEATVTGVRYMFSGSSTTQLETIESNNIRALNGSKAQTYDNVTSITTDYSVSVVEGAKQVIIAVPATLKVTAVYDSGAFGTPILSEFTKSTIAVEGKNGFTAANYSVYVYSPLSALGANTYYVKVETA